MELMQDARTDRQSLNNVDNKTSLRAYFNLARRVLPSRFDFRAEKNIPARATLKWRRPFNSTGAELWKFLRFGAYIILDKSRGRQLSRRENTA